MRINGTDIDEIGLAEIDLSGDDPIQLDDAKVYKAGWNRNGFGVRASDLEAYAATAEATPILFEHDPTQIMGSSSGMRVEDGVLLQSMLLDAPLARRILGLGIAPRFSIHPQRTQTSRIECSACGSDMMSRQCPHWPGQRLADGQTVMGWITDPSHAETSITFTPAVPGTGLSDDDALALSIQRSKMAPEPPAPDRESEIDTLSQRIAAHEATIAEMGARLAERDAELADIRHREVIKRVREVRLAKALSGSEDDLIRLYEQSPETFERLIASVPDSKLVERVTGPAPVLVTPEKGTFADLSQRAQALHESTGKPIAECWRICREGTT